MLTASSSFPSSLLSLFAVDDMSNSSSASYANSWISYASFPLLPVLPARTDLSRSPVHSWFLASKGNEYFSEIDEEYIHDRFNLTGLNVEVQGYSGALELITDTAGEFRRVLTV